SWFCIAGILLAFVAFGQEDSPHSTLRLIFRHGDRTPTETYPTDPHRDSRVWPDGWGQLTKEGKMQMYNLGQFLRTRYNGYINDLYSSDEMIMQSSANDRCLMSAQVVLAGLYPPVGYQVWNDELHWQPIPVHSTPRNLDQLIVMKKPCPRNEQELEKAYQSSRIQEINQKNAQLYEYLTTHTGKEIQNITAVEFLYNTLEIEDNHGLKLPEWTTSVYPEKMKKLAAMSLAIFTSSDIQKRLIGGPLVGEITRNMENKRTGSLKPDRKMVLYSAHDLTIVNVWRALGFTDLIKPEYGAALLFELHVTRSGTDHEVKMLYRNNTSTKNLFILNMPNCAQPCHLDMFLKLTQPVIPIDWDQECHNTLA
ncbi:hypothetical protein L9F63_020041, partial [Diploptera punctata]